MMTTTIDGALRILIALTVYTLSACAADDYDGYLNSLPTVDRNLNQEAVSILATYYEVPVGTLDVRWVTEMLVSSDGQEAWGITIGCTSWVVWTTPRPELDRVETSRLYSTTAMAHEVAHCVLSQRAGDPDSEHARSDWWYAGGVVDGARRALLAEGL